MRPAADWPYVMQHGAIPNRQRLPVSVAASSVRVGCCLDRDASAGRHHTCVDSADEPLIRIGTCTSLTFKVLLRKVRLALRRAASASISSGVSLTDHPITPATAACCITRCWSGPARRV